jgi:LAO/AO transport system kinase
MRHSRADRALRPRPDEALSLDAVHADGKAALARALTRIELAPDAPATVAFLDAAYRAARAVTIGLTGPPGVGKSTLGAALIESWRASGRTVGVIAVDPSSRLSGGAFLGDRARLRTDPADAGVFVRSMAARDRLGGIADLTFAAMVLMRALFDLVLIETVGVGQSEAEIATIVDTLVLCVQPGAGDSLQFMKAGLFELPHLIVVTKTDMGEAANRARADLAAIFNPAERSVELVGVSARTGEGIGALVEAIDRRHGRIASTLESARRVQARLWVASMVKERWGAAGLNRWETLGFDPMAAPFTARADIGRRFAD